jgi:hypothetical protein
LGGLSHEVKKNSTKCLLHKLRKTHLQGRLGGREKKHANNQIAQAFAQATAPVQLQAGVCVTRYSPD